jgi:hypothetical protein
MTSVFYAGDAIGMALATPAPIREVARKAATISLFMERLRTIWVCKWV